MNKLIKILISFVFVLLFAFTSIGYASLTQNMSVKGFMGLSELKAIYIVSVKQVDASDGCSVSNISYTNTLLTTNVTLKRNDATAYITLEITVKNNTENMEAGFNDFITSSTKIEYGSEHYSNSNPTGIHYMDKRLSPGEFRTFRMTITYKNSIASTVSRLQDVVKIDFIPWSIHGANAVFERLLNEDFSSLNNAMSYNYSGRNDSYISNVDGASTTDKKYVDGQFEGNMTTFIPDKNTGELIETKMTIFIKRANIDGNSKTGDTNGDEYVLFMTADLLNVQNSSAIVYACVYTRFSQDEDYVMVGEMFEGTARVCHYSGSSGTGSFTTNEWKSSRAYYGVSAGGGTYSAWDDNYCGNLRAVVNAAISARAY